MSQSECSTNSSCLSEGCARSNSAHPADLSQGPRVPVQALAFLFTKTPGILRVAIVPYFIAFALIYTGRSIGAPICFAISPWHVLAVLAFDTAVIRLAMGPAYVAGGRTVMELAVPRLTWPGRKAVLSVLASALQVVLPVGTFLLGFGLVLKESVVAADSLALKVGLLLVPVFVLNAVLSLVIAITLSRLRQAEALREIS